MRADTDWDWYSDYEEVRSGTDPLNPLDSPGVNMFEVLALIGLSVPLLLGVSSRIIRRSRKQSGSDGKRVKAL